MPYFATSQEWLHQSSLLVEARPSTTKITTKYHLPSASAVAKSRKRKAPSHSETVGQEEDDNSVAAPPKALLTLKTYDPISGVVLKYETDKAQEVGRLVSALGRLGKGMAAIPVNEDTATNDAPTGVGAPESTPSTSRNDSAAPTTASKPGQQSGGGGGKRKKKGKR